MTHTPKMTLQEATLIADRDRTPQCKTCTNMAQEGKAYCWYCEDYWKDVDQGLFEKWDYKP